MIHGPGNGLGHEIGNNLGHGIGIVVGASLGMSDVFLKKACVVCAVPQLHQGRCRQLEYLRHLSW